MYLFVLQLLCCVTASRVDYSGVLKSPTKLLYFFKDYSTKFSLNQFSDNELGLRIRLFRRELQDISRDNKQNQWESDLNQFSVMTPEEKSEYLGMNMSSVLPSSLSTVTETKEHQLSQERPEVKDWRTAGLVTGVKHQGKCGSCWSYAAVGPMETVYAQVTGKLKQFSEQEFVDCAYVESYDSCRGGWVTTPWNYAIESGRLATQRALPYVGRDRTCDVSSTHNGLIAAKLTGYTFLGAGEHKVIAALSNSVLAAGFRVSNNFFRYASGIIADDTCYSDFRGYHAVTIVGYTPKAIIVKNSWGTHWGEKGYFNWARGHEGCTLYDYTSRVEMEETGEEDEDESYQPEDGEEPCVITDPDCACGTVKCGDGVCRHEHMC